LRKYDVEPSSTLLNHLLSIDGNPDHLESGAALDMAEQQKSFITLVIIVHFISNDLNLPPIDVLNDLKCMRLSMLKM